ncbi:MAG: Asp-tRNA(Asn)/Glu-tRNA(Gln) amidotransferase subunit GatB [Candidatus Omnitrophica bacterium]|nr:Asp-tRNA(Asn)/Glu-tRNA(Gln) amidotransferase subunit GatB [Candidatus Omnitrophota bacterium]
MNQKYEAVIGLEVHVQLATQSKLFSGAPTHFGAEPNSNTTPICMGWPGTLPVLNEAALKLAIKAGLALNCRIAERLKFDRKHYFYPDLPKAYQISQYDMPVNGKGSLTIELEDEQGGLQIREIGITRAHLEEDAGKLLHEGIKDGSLVDYNRAGMPLLEIVSEPDIRTPAEAYAYLTALKAILQYLEVSDCNMEEGSLRCDANVSVRLIGETKFGTKTEIKNLNSFKAVQKAIQYEIDRQIEIVEGGDRVVQETRLWNDVKSQTFAMRSKEEAHDYRYFPDPDLVPFTIDRETVEEIQKSIPELPAARTQRFMKECGLSRYDASVLVGDKKLGDYFEAVIATGADSKLASNWIQSELLAILNERKIPIENSPVGADALAGLISLIQKNTISGKIAKDVLPMMFETGKTAEVIVKEKGLVQVTDTKLIEEVADRVLAANPKVVADFRAGKGQAVGFLVGQVMKETKGKANPKIVNEILTQKLS